MNRCSWANGLEAMERYHDEEWGRPVHDERRLFECLVLETMQAGLSWRTVLLRRDDFRAAFHNFDVERLAQCGEADIEEWMANSKLIRNRQKLAALIGNARAFLKVQEELGSFDSYQWSFVNGLPIVNCPPPGSSIPGRTELSDAFSKDLKRRGFSFLGTVTCYAHMQATGMVNDHTADCFVWDARMPGLE